MTAYYNEIDPFAASWLRELIQAGHIAPGDVDERSIEDVRPADLLGYTQCHFFAGIGGWSLALRLAGIPDDYPIWTGSCPCQPFSSAGAGAGFDDPRHLWPSFAWLIAQCRPAVVAGEQVASKATGPWFDLVQADLEAMGYAFGLAAFPAAGIGAPHIRDRAYWVGRRLGTGLEGYTGDGCGAPGWPESAGSVAEAGGALRLADSTGKRWDRGKDTARQAGRDCSQDSGADGGLADSDSGQQPGEPIVQRSESNRENTGRQEGISKPESCCDIQWVANPNSNGRSAGSEAAQATGRRNSTGAEGGNDRPEPAGPTNGHWGAADWLLCRDGKWRPVEPGTFPLANGIPNRVGRLRGYGNAIVPQQAAEFLVAALDGDTGG